MKKLNHSVSECYMRVASNSHGFPRVLWILWWRRCFSSRGCNEYADFPDDSTGSSGTFSKEDMQDIEERVRESKLVIVVQEPIYRAGRKLSEINKGDRARKDDMSEVCSSTVADQRKK